MIPELYDRSQEPAVISKPLSDLLLKQKKPAELIALYWFYYYTAKWQQTNQPKATNSYVAKALHWSSARVGKLGRELEGLGLIKKIMAVDPETKLISGHYVRVNFIWDGNKQPYIKKTILKEDHSMVNQGINALSSNRSNALSSNNKKDFLKTADKFDPLDLPVHLSKHPAVTKAWAEFVQHRREIGHRLTPTAYQKIIKTMLHRSPESIVASIDKTIESGWRGLFFAPGGDSPSRRVIERDASLDSDAQRFYEFAITALDVASVPSGTIRNLTDQMHAFYDQVDHLKNPYAPDKGPTDHMSWRKFFGEWLEFLEEKQQAGFVLRSVRDLELTGCRWREYIQRCEDYTSYS